MDLEARTMRQVTLRLVPFLILCYFVAYLDRVNVSFAALTMNKDLGISQTAFGLGAGIFFVTYFIFEVPSNLLLEKFGARRWIARIMFTWGILSGCMALVQGEKSFYAVRLLLGAAEAGFFPGIIFFLTLWFPAQYRARIIGYFMAAIPLSSVLGSPVSGLLLRLDGFFGLASWQWLFMLEALPALILSGVVLVYLTDRPADARWLPADGRAWLANRLADEEAQRNRAQSFSIGQALGNPRVLALAFVYFGGVACNYGVGFFMPQIVKGFGLGDIATGFVTAIPYIVGVVGIVYWGRHSDIKQERKLHTAFALAIAGGGIIGSTFLADPTLKMVALSVAAFGVFGCLPTFWALPTSFLSGAAAAGGIAIINALGNLSGFAGPYAMGYLKDRTGDYNAGLQLLGVFGFLAMIVVLVLRHDPALERVPEGRPSPAE